MYTSAVDVVRAVFARGAPSQSQRLALDTVAAIVRVRASDHSTELASLLAAVFALPVRARCPSSSPAPPSRPQPLIF